MAPQLGNRGDIGKADTPAEREGSRSWLQSPDVPLPQLRRLSSIETASTTLLRNRAVPQNSHPAQDILAAMLESFEKPKVTLARVIDPLPFKWQK